MRHMIFLAVSVLGAASALAAEDVGDPQAGFEYAHRVCSGCHGISAENFPRPQGHALSRGGRQTRHDRNSIEGVDRDLSPDHAQYRRR